jgi:hypothetical protein
MTDECRTDGEPDLGDLVIILLASTLSRHSAIGLSGTASPRRLSASRKPWQSQTTTSSGRTPATDPTHGLVPALDRTAR